MQDKPDQQDFTTIRSNPIHVVASEPRLPRADALRAVRQGLLQAEQNLFQLVHAKRPNGAPAPRRQPPPFILTPPETPDGGSAITPSFVPWIPWSYSGDGVRAE